MMIKKMILPFIIIFILVFVYSYFLHPLFNDEIWNYGFGYNIYKGLIPYRDYNMVITPLYSFLVCLFIYIFGNHLWSLHILNSIIVSLIIILMYIKLNKKIFIILPFILSYSYPGYNIFSLFLFIVLLFLIDKEFVNNDLVILFICSLIFLTKQSVGIFMFIPIFYLSKNKIKSLIIFLIPIFIFLIYLLYFNAFYSFINYCFLGMFDFSKSNKILLFLPIELIIIIILIYKICIYKFKKKELIYLLFFQIMCYPIFDDYHFMISFIPVFYYFLSSINIKSRNIKYYFIMSSFLVIFYSYKISYVNYFDNFNYYSNSESFLYGRLIDNHIENKLNEVSDYVIDKKDDYDMIYILNGDSYIIKLNTGILINKYDLINNGNMGYNGSYIYIKEIREYCKYKKCLFILNQNDIYKNAGHSQINDDIIRFVYNKYNKIYGISIFNIYSN